MNDQMMLKSSFVHLTTVCGITGGSETSGGVRQAVHLAGCGKTLIIGLTNWAD